MYNDNQFITLVAAAAISEGQRVKLTTSGQATPAGLNEYDVGTAMRDASGAGVELPVFTGKHGVREGIANVAIAAGDLLYPAASGRFTNVAGTTAAVAYAYTAASGAGVKFQYVCCT